VKVIARMRREETELSKDVNCMGLNMDYSAGKRLDIEYATEASTGYIYWL
jgi:hypothetical protein